MTKRLLFGLGVVLALGWVVAALAFAVDMRRAYRRIGSGSRVVASPFGDVEYAEGGAGPAVLVVHGSGGGFDQGELMVRTLLGDGYRWIAPSRFGYLRSTFHPGATFDDQADAYAWLLDHLGVERAAVVALSHGGPSALLFAARHPERVSALVLVSAGVASSPDAAQAQANRQGDALRSIFQHDSAYWAMTHLSRRRFLQIMGADRGVIQGLDGEQRELVDEVIDGMNPVSRRAAGVVFDNEAALPDGRISAIRAPTLILHARDDTLQLFRNAEYAAATIPTARLVAFDHGGHLLMVVERRALRRRIEEHMRQAEPPVGTAEPG